MWKKVISLLMLAATMSAHRISQLQVPLYADPRRAAELTCHFDMAGQKLHSLKWYRDMSEIFRYNPSQTPSIRLFNVSGVMVQGGECQVESCTLQVMPAPLSMRATFTCEVSTEGPKFKIARESKQMTVVAMPSSDPVISGAPDTVKAGEQHLLNCTSDLSLPPAEIRWYIDDELQKLEPWQHTEQGDPQTGGVRSSWRTLRLVVPPLDSGALRVRCETVLDVEPPVVKHAEESIPIVSRTQLSKYVASGGTLTRQDLLILIVTSTIRIFLNL
ncbi:uncharacterized protein LOC121730199 [Aricia agestis]|uniref:uncharacterized protein LOC121730199 n=1 Tax=Aricia agestis TaxID=91739 RepID=UPI001C20B812|nr:uncharacterized protein LOC121730199 [Aricia agestis]